MRRAALALASLALAAPGCGGGDDEEDPAREPTRDHVVAALQEIEPDCGATSQTRLSDEGGIEVLQISCESGTGVTLTRVPDPADAQRLAESGSTTDYVAGRVVIGSHSPDGNEPLRKALAEKCGCELKVVRNP